MNIPTTSREEILHSCLELVKEKGLKAVNMRTVAKRCDVAVGSIYNYFPSKSDLLLATIEIVWKEIFHMEGENDNFKSFDRCVKWIFESVTKGKEQFPEFFTIHSVSLASVDKEKGHKLMEKYLGHIKYNMLLILRQDPKVKEDAFNDVLTDEVFVDYVFSILLHMFLENKDNCDGLLELIKKCIY